MPIFEPGQLVRLRGSLKPLMVLSNYEEQRGELFAAGWLCFWSIQGAVRSQIIPEAALEPAPEKTTGEAK